MSDEALPVAPLEMELRDRVVRAAIDDLRARANRDSTWETVSRRAGVVEGQARSLFDSFDALLLETLRVWNGRRMAEILTDGAQLGGIAFLRRVIQWNLADPGLNRLVLALVSAAATPGHPFAPQLQREWVRFHAVVQRMLVQDVSTGREPDTMDPSRGAEQLIAMYEGLQVQAGMRPHFDLLEAWDRAVTRLRDGWSKQYQPVVWDI